MLWAGNTRRKFLYAANNCKPNEPKRQSSVASTMVFSLSCFWRSLFTIAVPVYTILFSNENGKKSCRVGLSFTLKRFLNRHRMQTILKMGRFENGIKRLSVNTGTKLEQSTMKLKFTFSSSFGALGASVEVASF